MIGLDNLNADDLEVLGEKALSEGHVDILIKDRVPIVQARKIAIEVKLHKAQRNELMQLRKYMNELGEECLLGVLIAESFPRRFINEAEKYNIRLVRYKLSLN
jgi:RecB family endonuclease NucS